MWYHEQALYSAHRPNLSRHVKLAIFRPLAQVSVSPHFFVETDAGNAMVEQPPHFSRRLNSRIETGKSVWVYWESNAGRDLSPVMNLSAGGLFLATPKIKRLGATTRLHFLVPEGHIRAEAEVRHVKPGVGLGLKFKAVTEKDRPNLAALMRRLRSLAQEDHPRRS